MNILLSHKIGRNNPSYGNPNLPLKYQHVNSIEKGNSSNTFSVTIDNHVGTHIDAPSHFFENGKKISEYEIDFFCFTEVQIIDVDLTEGQIMTASNLHKPINKNTDLLLLRSNWSDKRGENSYSVSNPGISPSFAEFLRHEYPNIKCLGMDWISVSSFSHRELGRETHRKFLDPDGMGDPILLIEDMFIPQKVNNFKEVIVLPIFVECIDSAPVTIIGRTE